MQAGSTIQSVRDIFRQELSGGTPGSQRPLKDSVTYGLGEAIRLGVVEKNVAFLLFISPPLSFMFLVHLTKTPDCHCPHG